MFRPVTMFRTNHSTREYTSKIGSVLFQSIICLCAILHSNPFNRSSVIKFYYKCSERKNQTSEKVINLNPGEYYTCLPLTTRPRYTALVPRIQIELYGETQTASRHHIIPFATLKNFYNLVVAENLNSPRGAYIAQRLSGIWEKFSNNEHNDATITIGDQTKRKIKFEYRIQATYAWMPGNIFYGPNPSRRFDDPQENFEEGSEKIVGRDIFLILKRLNGNMLEYINNPTQQTIVNFDRIINDLSIICARKTPYVFNQEDWILAGYEKNGRKLYGIK